ncbi:ThiF family adenylyltransferase [Paenibacillus xylanexedens]|uniref:Molybdopterin/thiamine biosynthesis adenylyltransferase n=1 Tax=Paenibacillus xylanexedens TaxID=528191 RepID=A0ABS4S1E1_PAEXY|nr:ThiF family adenylyltransferase [Paenibacillus xylanexedens]MBP2248941.1 molybdopterin/thiamine biosynthesis adenylyltransferase [Paenibacillus xylanexedens]
MDDQLSLETYYDEVLHVVTLHLLKEYGAEEAKNFDNHNFSHVYRIHQNNVAIDLAIPLHYPDSFPVVKIPDPYYARIYPIPHLDNEHTLCVFDSEEAHPNPENPIGVIDAVIERAFNIIQQGLKKENISDFFDEINAYWAENSSENILSLIQVNVSAREVNVIECEFPNLGKRLLAVDSVPEGIRWVSQAGGKSESTTRKAYYFPVRSIGVPPFPRTNGQLMKRIQEYSPEIVTPFIQFLDQCKRPSMILFSVETSNGRVLGAWEHQEPKQINRAAHQSKRKLERSIDGFRTGYRNARIEMNFFKDAVLKHYSVVRVEKERLVTRGGDGVQSGLTKVGIIGCGSIGSQIANNLCDLGVDQFMFIDKDLLTFENIARHLCGATYVGENKVDAVGKSISSRLPYIRYNAYHGNILNILRSNETILNGCDLTIVATANLPTELRIDELQRLGIIDKPLLYVWVEPYLAAAHAVFINPMNPGCFRDLFDDMHQFRETVLDNPGQYAIREAGCQSTYVPYSVIEVKRFIHELMFFVQEILEGKIKDNMLFTWVGKISSQITTGRNVNDIWSDVKDYSVVMHKLISEYIEK